jgi:hypothetical protein
MGSGGQSDVRFAHVQMFNHVHVKGVSLSITKGMYNFALKYFIYLFQAFDKFYSWFPSFLDIFPDEAINFSPLFTKKIQKKLSRTSKEYFNKPALLVLCWNGSFLNIASLLLPHRGRITKKGKWLH